MRANELTLALIAGDDKKCTDEKNSSILDCGFSNPILIENKTGLDMALPHPTFSVVDVENYVGE